MAKKNLIVGLATGVAIAASTLVALSGTAMAGKEAATAKIGEPAPAFTLTGLDGKTYTLADFTKDGKIVVLEWWNPGCPFVVKHHEHSTTMADTAAKYADKGVVWMAINSTNPDHKDFGLDKEMVKKWNVAYPALVDSDGAVGHMYGAQTTPHMFIVDAQGVLRYNGAIDSDKGMKPAADPSTVTNYVDQALAQILAGETVTMPETKPYGCSVKFAAKKAN
jgi:peroxiredoxin